MPTRANELLQCMPASGASQCRPKAATCQGMQSLMQTYGCSMDAGASAACGPCTFAAVLKVCWKVVSAYRRLQAWLADMLRSGLSAHLGCPG